MLESIVASLFGLVAGAAYITFVYNLIRRRAVERGGISRKAKGLFFEELHRRITLGVIKDLDDVAMVRSWAGRQEESPRFQTIPLDELLEEFLGDLTQNMENEESTREKYTFIELLVDIKRAQEPFSILPTEERVKAQRLQKSIESGQIGEATSQLQEMANSLGGRFQDLSRAVARNRNLAIIAAIASISAIPIAILF